MSTLSLTRPAPLSPDWMACTSAKTTHHPWPGHMQEMALHLAGTDTDTHELHPARTGESEVTHSRRGGCLLSWKFHGQGRAPLADKEQRLLGVLCTVTHRRDLLDAFIGRYCHCPHSTDETPKLGQLVPCPGQQAAKCESTDLNPGSLAPPGSLHSLTWRQEWRQLLGGSCKHVFYVKKGILRC